MRFGTCDLEVQSCTFDRRAAWTSNILTSLWPDYADPVLNSLQRRKNSLGHIHQFYDLCYRNIFIPMMTVMKWSYDSFCLDLFLYSIDDCALLSYPWITRQELDLENVASLPSYCGSCRLCRMKHRTSHWTVGHIEPINRHLVHFEQTYYSQLCYISSTL